jgi:hypothetical protein
LFDVLNRVRGLDIHRNSLSCKCLHKYLHFFYICKFNIKWRTSRSLESQIIRMNASWLSKVRFKN